MNEIKNKYNKIISKNLTTDYFYVKELPFNFETDFITSLTDNFKSNCNRIAFGVGYDFKVFKLAFEMNKNKFMIITCDFDFNENDGYMIRISMFNNKDEAFNYYNDII